LGDESEGYEKEVTEERSFLGKDHSLFSKGVKREGNLQVCQCLVGSHNEKEGTGLGREKVTDPAICKGGALVVTAVGEISRRSEGDAGHGEDFGGTTDLGGVGKVGRPYEAQKGKAGSNTGGGARSREKVGRPSMLKFPGFYCRGDGKLGTSGGLGVFASVYEESSFR